SLTDLVVERTPSIEAKSTSFTSYLVGIWLRDLGEFMVLVKRTAGVFAQTSREMMRSRRR
ncbi:MAG: hypothetical protein QF637_13695, partial [Acidimicrobiales bacterium]|nr:hypothetical protein [Acidimicrobiales bacterium]